MRCRCVVRHVSTKAERERVKDFLEQARARGLELQVMVAMARLAPCPRLRKAG